MLGLERRRSRYSCPCKRACVELEGQLRARTRDRFKLSRFNSGLSMRNNLERVSTFTILNKAKINF